MNRVRTFSQCCAVLALAAVLPDVTFAQEEVMEEIVVTGSYIRGSSQDAASPVQVIDRENMDIQGAFTAEDVTRNLTINSGTTTNFNFDTENATIAGMANVNLRGLGLNSTLVLVNGKRQVVAAAETQDGSEFVDINTIPMAMLERVEVLKDGGSAIYGSDAIAGVVNFIMRDDYDGFDLQGNFGALDDGVGEEYRLSAVWGKNFNDGKGNFSIGVEYFDRDPVGFNDLGLTTEEDRVTVANSTLNVIIPSAFSGAGLGLDLNTAYVNPEISAIRGGTFFTDPLCDDLGYFTGLFSETVNEPNQHCRFDNREFREVQVAQQRVSTLATFKYEFNEAAELYAMGQYYTQDVERFTSGAFGPIDSFNAVLPVGDPVWGLGSRSDEFVGALLGGGLPAGLAALPRPANAPNLGINGGPNALTYMGFQLSEHGTYEFNDDKLDSESETYGGHIGLRGIFVAADREMTYDVSVSHTQTTTYREELTVERNGVELALNGLGGPNCVPNGVDDYDLVNDPNDFIGGGVFGQNGPIGFTFTNAAPGYVLNMRRNISLALTSTNQGQGDCMFLNPYLTKEDGTLANDPELIESIYAIVPLEDRKNELTVFDAVFTSQLWQMGGDWAAGAIGYQYRDQRNRGAAYPFVNPGLTDFVGYGADEAFIPVSNDNFYGQFTRDFDDERNIHAVFGELNLPFTPKLEMQLAVRWEDYGGAIGDEVSPKVALRWQPIESVALRGSYSQAFRAPNTGVLFKGVGFDGQAAVDFLNKPEVRAGLLPPTEENADVVAIIQNGSASPDVGPETADTYNIGVIFTPTGLEGFRLSLDYYQFEFQDKVVNAPLSITLDRELDNFVAAAADPNNYIDQTTFQPCVQGSSVQCVVNPSTYATPGVQRSPQGGLQVVDFQNINAGKIDTSGIDLLASYSFDTGLGLWTLQLDWNHIIEFVPSDIPGFENGILGTGITDAAGTSGDGSIARSMPDNKGNFMVNFNRGGHNATAFVRYIDAYDNLGAAVFNSPDNPPRTEFSEKVKSWTTLDLQYNYRWQWGDAGPLSLTFGIINVTDELPPKRDDFAQGFDSTTHDPRGRRFYIGVQQSF